MQRTLRPDAARRLHRLYVRTGRRRDLRRARLRAVPLRPVGADRPAGSRRQDAPDRRQLTLQTPGRRRLRRPALLREPRPPGVGERRDGEVGARLLAGSRRRRCLLVARPAPAGARLRGPGGVAGAPAGARRPAGSGHLYEQPLPGPSAAGRGRGDPRCRLPGDREGLAGDRRRPGARAPLPPFEERARDRGLAGLRGRGGGGRRAAAATTEASCGSSASAGSTPRRTRRCSPTCSPVSSGPTVATGDWLVCGEGPLEGALRQRLEDLGVGERAELLGYVQHGEAMRQAYADAHMLLHVSWTEGLPQVIIEALAARLPVVATDVGGIGDAVGPAAILIAPGDVGAAISALEDLRRGRRLARLGHRRGRRVRSAAHARARGRSCGGVHPGGVRPRGGRLAPSGHRGYSERFPPPSDGTGQPTRVRTVSLRKESMRANRSSRRPLGVLLVAAVAVMALALPTSALAANPTDTEYDPTVQLEVAASSAGGSNNGGVVVTRRPAAPARCRSPASTSLPLRRSASAWLAPDS